MSSDESDFASTCVGLISWFIASYIAERLLRDAVSYYNPRFYESLRASRRDLVFFAIAMGIITTALSTPFCAYAAIDEFSSHPPKITTDSHGPWRLNYLREQWDLAPHARVCVAARGVVWLSSLYRVDMDSPLALHYGGSIFALLSWLHFQWPNLIFLTTFTTLISEIPGDLVLLVTAYRETVGDVSPTLERFGARLAQVNMVQYALVRGGSILAVARMLLLDNPGVQDRPIAEQLYAYGQLAVYSAFYASFLLRHYPTRRKSIPVFLPEKAIP